MRLAEAGTGALEWGEIVGVARDVTSIFPESQPVTLKIYQPMAQEPRAYNEISHRGRTRNPRSGHRGHGDSSRDHGGTPSTP